MKPDSEQIREFLIQLAEKDWVKRTSRRSWPRFAFHYTDITNAISILQDDVIYSRQYAENLGKLVTSSGSTKILSATHSDIKNCVRFYFRPRTPTQYWAEGIRSKTSLKASNFPDAHCPVPIFFLFDLTGILVRDDSWFSDGNLRSRQAKRFSEAKELEMLPWQKIYHDRSYDPKYEDIAFHRSAEIAVPNSLDLSSLRYVFCRSEAEKETLLYLLSPHSRNKYKDKIVATSRTNLFFRQHTFIQTARLSPSSADFDFSPETKSDGPFSLRVELEIGSRSGQLEKAEFMADKKLLVPFRTPFSNYIIRVYLDEHLVYANRFEEFDIPF